MITQFMLVKMLKDWNLKVSVADNGNIALERLKVEDYDLVLMDIHMPGQNGYQVARAIRMDLEKSKRSVPIISLSAAAYEHEQKEALSSGMNDVLSKPFEPHELHIKITKLLNGKAKKAT
nr:response regulator [Mucilaginibacter psychrotolerans]